MKKCRKKFLGEISGRAGTVWKDHSGNTMPLAVAVTIGMLLLILGVSEYMRLVITAAGIRDAMESAVISTVNDNYNEVYHGVREGYATGHEPAGEGFAAAVDYGDISGRLCFLLGLEEDGDGYVRINDSGETEYRLSGLQVTIPNTSLASPGETYYADAAVTMKVPVRFAGKMITDMSINLKVRAAYKEKF